MPGPPTLNYYRPQTIMETTMSKGYSEALALIEAGKQMALGTVKGRPMRTEPKKKEFDILAELERKRREYEGLKAFVEQQNKLNKPEEKKKKEGWDRQDIALLLIATTPLTGPFYVMWFKTMLGM